MSKIEVKNDTPDVIILDILGEKLKKQVSLFNQEARKLKVEIGLTSRVLFLKELLSEVQETLNEIDDEWR